MNSVRVTILKKGFQITGYMEHYYDIKYCCIINICQSYRRKLTSQSPILTNFPPTKLMRQNPSKTIENPSQN